jgi:hypothetical protein
MKSLIYKTLKFFKSNLKGPAAKIAGGPFALPGLGRLCDPPQRKLLVVAGQFDGDGQVIAFGQALQGG